MIFNGRYLKEARQDANLTQGELGELVGVTGVTIMRYENNQRKPNKKTFDQLAKVLNVSPSFLAVGLSKEKWDAVDPNLQELFEFGDTENITTKQPSFDFYFNDLSHKENKIFNELAANYKKLNIDGMQEAARSVSIIAGNPVFQRKNTTDPADPNTDTTE